MMEAAGTPLAIVGATGVTGGYAFDAAMELGFSPVAIGRDRGRLLAFARSRGLDEAKADIRMADPHDPESLRRAFDGVGLVISTIAPFHENGFEIARIAAEMGLGYTDPSGETGFIQSIIEELDAVAQASGATLCPGNGIAAFLGDIAIRSLVDVQRDVSGAVLYDIQNYAPSWGSFRSYLTSILPSGAARIRDGKMELRRIADTPGRVGAVSGYNSIVPDAMVVSRYWRPETFDGLGKGGRVSRIAMRGAGLAVTETWLGRLLLKLPFERWLRHDPVRDAKSRVVVHAEVRDANGHARRRSLVGEGVYAVTGRILAGTALAMARRPDRPVGVRAASEMFASLEDALAVTSIRELSPQP